MSEGFRIIEPRAEIFERPPQAFIDSNQVTVNVLEKISYPLEEDGGGIYVYYLGAPYPRKGAPKQDVIVAMNTVKKALLGLAYFARDCWYLLPVLFLVRKSIIQRFGHWTKEVLNQHRLKRYRYCISGREWFKLYDRIQNEYLREIVLSAILIWEFDVAYRYPGQDALGELNLERFRENQRKEFLRIMAIGAERHWGQTSKWKAFAKLGGFLLLIPNIKRFAKEVAEEINWDNIKLDKGDTYWVLSRKDYNYFGKSAEERLEILENYD